MFLSLHTGFPFPLVSFSSSGQTNLTGPCRVAALDCLLSDPLRPCRGLQLRAGRFEDSIKGHPPHLTWQEGTAGQPSQLGVTWEVQGGEGTLCPGSSPPLCHPDLLCPGHPWSLPQFTSAGSSLCWACENLTEPREWDGSLKSHLLVFGQVRTQTELCQIQRAQQCYCARLWAWQMSSIPSWNVLCFSLSSSFVMKYSKHRETEACRAKSHRPTQP